MSKLIEALRKKYKSPYAALAVLGLDASVLEDQSNEPEKEPTMPYHFTVATRARDVHFSRRKFAMDYARRHRGVIMAYDGTAQFEREQYAGLPTEFNEDDENSEFYNMTCDDDRLASLKAYLEKNSTLTPEEIAEACKIASEHMGEDEPAPFSGRPNTGGRHDPLTSASRSNEPNRNGPRPGGATDSRLIFKQDGVMDSRNVALAFASRIQRDNSVPTQFYAPPVQSTKARKQLAHDASISHSSAAQADFYSRFPDVAKIGRA
jgi:hypothetical protein